MKRYIIIFSLTLLASCAFNPPLGATFDEFMNDWLVSSNFDAPVLVDSYSGTDVYESEGVYYYFRNGRLDSVDDGRTLRENEKKQQ